MLDKTTSAELKELRARRKTIAHQMTAMLRNKFTAASAATFEVLNLAAEQLRQKIQTIEPDSPAQTRSARNRAFSRYLRYGLHASPERGTFGISTEDRDLLMPALPAETRDIGTGGEAAYPGATAGFFAPMEFANKTEAALKFYGDMFLSSTIQKTGTGTPYPYPNSDDTSVSGEQVSEGAQVTSQDIASVGQVVLNSYKYSSRLLKVSQELAQDAYYDFDAYLAEQFGIRLARAANAKFTSGTGVGQPMGIITAAVDSGVTVTGDENASPPDPTTQIGWNDLVGLEQSVDPLYRRRGAFMMHDNTLGYIKTLKDHNGRPIYKSSLTEGSLGMLLDHPLYLNNAMDQLEAGKKPVLFGALDKYVIRQVKQMWVSRLTETYVTYGQIGFIGWVRWDGNLLSAGNPVKYLTMHS
jgi:HK97 family phage major capsid protein